MRIGFNAALSYLTLTYDTIESLEEVPIQTQW